MTVSPLIPVWAIALLVGVALWGVCARTWGIARVLRVAALVCLGLVLFGWSDAGERPSEPDKPMLAVVIDRSASMLRTRLPGSTEADGEALADVWSDGDALAALARAADVSWFDQSGEEMAGPVFIGEGEEGADASPLVRTVGGLADAFDDVLLISDGIDTQGGVWSSVERIGEARLHTLRWADAETPANARLRVHSEQELVYRGQGVDVIVGVEHSRLSGRSGLVDLYEDGRLIETRRVQLGDDAERLRFRVIPEPGDSRVRTEVAYRAVLRTIAGEATDADNAGTVFVRVTDEPVRLVLFEGQPNWRTRAFVTALRGDGRIDASIVQAVAGAGASGAALSIERVVPAGRPEPGPVSIEEITRGLGEFDVVVLGGGIEEFFPSRRADELRAYVEEQGGSVVLLREDPVRGDDPGASRARRLLGPLTASAADRDLVEGWGALRLGRVGSGYVARAGAEALPAGVLRAQERAELHRRWSRGLRTLAIAGEATDDAGLALLLERQRVRPGEDAGFSVRRVVGDGGLRVEVVSPSGERRMLEVDASDRGRVRVEEEGVHLLVASSAEGEARARFVAEEDRPEYLLLSVPALELEAASRRSGGLVLDPAAGPSALASYLGDVRSGRQRIAAEIEVWRAWWIYALVVGLYVCAWIAERRAVR